jgi:hypothetical protein
MANDGLIHGIRKEENLNFSLEQWNHMIFYLHKI